MEPIKGLDAHEKSCCERAFGEEGTGSNSDNEIFCEYAKKHSFIRKDESEFFLDCVEHIRKQAS